MLCLTLALIAQLPPKPNLNPSWLKDAAKAAGGVAANKLSPAKKKVPATPGTPQAAAATKVRFLLEEF